uniref:Uncharacterized protein n=1 Tax=Setaria italica TaxID=4555 RepID=K3ZGM9_SETIT
MQMLHLPFLKIITSEVKLKALILSRKQMPDCKRKNLAYRDACSSF